MYCIPCQKEVVLVLDRASAAPPGRKVRNRQAVVCHGCNERGHYLSECATWKTRICWHWRFQKCRSHSICSFAHGEDDLRAPGGGNARESIMRTRRGESSGMETRTNAALQSDDDGSVC